MGWICKHGDFLTIDVEEIGDSSILLNFHSQFLLNTKVAWTHIHTDSSDTYTWLFCPSDDFNDSISHSLSTEGIPGYINTNDCFVSSCDTTELVKLGMVSYFITVEIWNVKKNIIMLGLTIKIELAVKSDFALPT